MAQQKRSSAAGRGALHPNSANSHRVDDVRLRGGDAVPPCVALEHLRDLVGGHEGHACVDAQAVGFFGLGWRGGEAACRVSVTRRRGGEGRARLNECHTTRTFAS